MERDTANILMSLKLLQDLQDEWVDSGTQIDRFERSARCFRAWGFHDVVYFGVGGDVYKEVRTYFRLKWGLYDPWTEFEFYYTRGTRSVGRYYSVEATVTDMVYGALECIISEHAEEYECTDFQHLEPGTEFIFIDPPEGMMIKDGVRLKKVRGLRYSGLYLAGTAKLSTGKIRVQRI